MQWLVKLSKKKAKAQNKLLGELLTVARQEKKMTPDKGCRPSGSGSDVHCTD
jgi:hypothetical protein